MSSAGRPAGLVHRVASWAIGHPAGAERVLVVALGLPVAAVSGTIALLSLTGPPAAVLVAAVVGAHAALLLRRTRPEVCVALVAGCVVVMGAVTGLFLILPSVLVVPFAVYGCAVYGRRWAAVAVLAVGGAGSAAVAVRFTSDPGVVRAGLQPGTLELFALLAVCVLAVWSLGIARRVHLHARAAWEAARMRDAARAERMTIAREMHDVVAHSVSVMVTQAKGGRYGARSRPEAATEALTVIEETGRRALDDMRGLLTVLRGDADPGAPAPQPTLAELPPLLARVRAAGLTVRLAEHGAARPLGGTTELAAYRLVQEALTNALRHAGTGACVDVVLRWSEDELGVTVLDDGTARREPTEGRGLTGMRERITAVGGTVRAAPRSAGGFEVSARLPLPERAQP